MRAFLGFVAVIVAVAVMPGCPQSNQIALPPPQSVAIQNVYWTLLASTPGPELEVAAFPLTTASTPLLTISSSPANKLDRAFELQFDSSGRLWVENQSNPTLINVFTLPLSTSSTPAFTLTFPDIAFAFGFQFDAQGNLWISSPNTNKVFKYSGPFSSSASLPASSAQLTLTMGLNRPEGLAFDGSGDLFVANQGVNFLTACVGSVAKFSAPVSNTAPTLLNGENFPVSLVFDAAGDLYVGSLANSTAGCVHGIARYNNGNFGTAAMPDIADSTGVPVFFFPAQLSIDFTGNLYAANCDSGPITVFPSVATQFSGTLAPTTNFTDPAIDTHCSAGVVAR